MANLILKGNTSGEVTIQAPAVAGTTTLTLPATSSTLATQNSLGVRNLIINGDMRIDQRNGGASLTINADSLYTLDRWKTRSAGGTSKFSVQQSSTAPNDFSYSALATSLATTTVGSGDVYCYEYKLEGLNVAHLKWGTANAKTVTLSFWVRSSLTGTFSGALKNENSNRSYPFSYTISSANTWEQKSITISGDTTGTWLITNVTGIRLYFSLGIGSTYQGTAGAWAASNLFGATGEISLVGTSGATLYITGVQLEVGDTATPFEHRPYDMELQRCMRYFQHIGKYGGEAQVGGFRTSTETQWVVNYYNTMRSAPTITLNGLSSHDLNDGDNLTLSSLGLVINAGLNSSWLSATNSGTGTVNGVAIVYPTGTPKGLYLSAEL